MRAFVGITSVTPLVPAQAGTQGPNTQALVRAALGSRLRGDERERWFDPRDPEAV